MIAYLFIKRPFESSFDFGQQLFFEFIGMSVNMCVFINAILDAGKYQAIQARKNIGKLVIVCNMIFNFVTAGFMVYSIGLVIYEFYKSQQAKRVKKLEAVQLSRRIPKLSHQETNLNSYSNVNTNQSQSFVHENKINQSEVISFQQESFDLSLLPHPTPFQNQYNRPRKIRKPYHEQQSPVQLRQRNHVNDNQIELDKSYQNQKVYNFSSQINQRR